jgi:hypothetical protein
MKGFSNEWCSWINHFTSKGNLSIRVNDNLGRFFQSKKVLRQGDPLSPLLFNLVADMLAILIDRAKIAGQVIGVLSHLVDKGLSIL